MQTRSAGMTRCQGLTSMLGWSVCCCWCISLSMAAFVMPCSYCAPIMHPSQIKSQRSKPTPGRPAKATIAETKTKRQQPAAAAVRAAASQQRQQLEVGTTCSLLSMNTSSCSRSRGHLAAAPEAETRAGIHEETSARSPVLRVETSPRLKGKVLWARKGTCYDTCVVLRPTRYC